MTHQRMLSRVPSVMLTSNKNELKLYQDNTIYLNNGDNFELRFFNPLQEKIGVEIIFNGIKKDEGYLVLYPGQDLTLDRFLNDQRKMTFETYAVDGNNQDAIEAIKKNGIITFNFYKEYNYPKYNYTYTYNTTTSNLYNTNITTSATNMVSNDYIVTMNTNNLNNLNTYSSSITNSANDLETGRIEKGNTSSQVLVNTNLQFSTTSFHTIEYKIMPYSVMNKTSNDVRLYCEDCGYRLRKQNWKFCPHCGNKLD